MNPCQGLAIKFGLESVKKCLITGHFCGNKLWPIGQRLTALNLGKRLFSLESEKKRGNLTEKEEEKVKEAHEQDGKGILEKDVSNVSLLRERIRILESDASGYIQKIEDSRDKLLRSLAEKENLRQRHEKELETARIYSITGFARSLLEVADSLSRALASVNIECPDENSLKSLYGGISMTSSLLEKALETHKVTKIQSLGKQFDPREHEAVFEVKDSSKPKGQICKELQPGYKIHNRILRAAKVATIKN